MTALPKNPRVSELRELFRNLNAFRAVYEETGLEDIRTPEGHEWSIWDLEYLHDQLPRLRTRQRQAIVLCLIHNMREREAALAMNVSETNPVMMYATLGLQRLLDMVDAGELTRYRERQQDPAELAAAHERSVTQMIDRIISSCRVMSNGCWIYPNPSTGMPKILLRSPRAASGFIILHPGKLLYETFVVRLPAKVELAHTKRIPPFSISCINPEHADAVLPTGIYRHAQQIPQLQERKALIS